MASDPLTPEQVAAINAMWMAETPEECSAAFTEFRRTGLQGMFGPHAAMLDWQPIETAPRDGTWVLLTGGLIDYGWYEDTQPQCVAGHFASLMPAPEGRWQFAWYDGGYLGEYEQPTHWMPLPAPPQAPEG